MFWNLQLMEEYYPLARKAPSQTNPTQKMIIQFHMELLNVSWRVFGEGLLILVRFYRCFWQQGQEMNYLISVFSHIFMPRLRDK